MKSNYLVIEEKKLVLETYQGVVTLDDCYKHKVDMLRNNDIDLDYKIISDMSRAVVDMPKKEISLLESKAIDFGINSAVLLHKTNRKLYERFYNRFRVFLPINHFYSAQMEELLQYFNISYLQKDIEFNLEKLHRMPKRVWA